MCVSAPLYGAEVCVLQLYVFGFPNPYSGYLQPCGKICTLQCGGQHQDPRSSFIACLHYPIGTRDGVLSFESLRWVLGVKSTCEIPRHGRECKKCNSDPIEDANVTPTYSLTLREGKSLRHTALWYELKSVISPLVLTLVPVLGPYLGHRARLCR